MFERAHEIVHFVVFINDVALEVPDVERFAFEHEHGLVVHVAAARDGAGGGLAFADENLRAVAFLRFFVEMIFAILELRDADGDGLGAFARELLDLLQFLAQLPRVLDLGHDLFGDLLVAIEEVQQFFAHVVDEFGADFGVAEFVLGLRFEHRVFQANRHRADHAFADVVAFVFGVAVFVDRFEQAFAKGAQVRAAVAGVLAVDEGIKRLAVAAVAVRETKFQRLARCNAAGDKCGSLPSACEIFHARDPCRPWRDWKLSARVGRRRSKSASGRC